MGKENPTKQKQLLLQGIAISFYIEQEKRVVLSLGMYLDVCLSFYLFINHLSVNH